MKKGAPAPRGGLVRSGQNNVRLVAAAALVVAVLVSAGAHIYAEGRDAMRASDDAIARGEPKAAITPAKRAAQARLFGSPFPGRGKDRLRTIAREAEDRNDAETATAAWRALRAACASTAVGAPDPCAREADDGIARLAARAGATDTAAEDDASPSAWLPLAVLVGVIALVVLVDRGTRLAT